MTAVDAYMGADQATGRDETTRVCIVDGWRDIEHRWPVCQRCEDRIAANLEELRQLVPLLPYAAVPARGHEDRLPVRLAVIDLTLRANTLPMSRDHVAYDQIGQTPIATRLGTWVRDWVESGCRPGWPPDDNASAIVWWLRCRLRWAIRQHPAVDDFAQDVRAALSAARHALNTALVVSRHATPCPWCSGTLLRSPGQPTPKGAPERGGWIECDGCGRLWDDDEYRAMTATTVPGWVLLTATQAAMVVRVPAERIRKWSERGRLLARPGPWGGRRVYELDDVRRLAGVVPVRDRESVLFR